MKTSELFDKELKLIKNEHMRNIVANTLDASPECIQTIPASSSGRYHPSASLGEGGLVRHVQSTVGIAKSLIETNVFRGMCFYNKYNSHDAEMLDIYKDCAYASLILHDCCKPDDTPKHGTRFDHPLLAASLFKEVTSKYIKENDINMDYMKTVVPIVYKAIACHMGQFSTAPYAKGIKLPEPSNGFETFVHMCDLLSSKRYIDFNFDKYK